MDSIDYFEMIKPGAFANAKPGGAVRGPNGEIIGKITKVWGDDEGLRATMQLDDVDVQALVWVNDGVHSHGKHEHAHAWGDIPHQHLLRGICMRSECEDYATHDIHPDHDSALAEYRRFSEANWCSGPARPYGHLVACTQGEGHDGDCVPDRYWRRDHDCRRNRCPHETLPVDQLPRRDY